MLQPHCQPGFYFYRIRINSFAIWFGESAKAKITLAPDIHVEFLIGQKYDD